MYTYLYKYMYIYIYTYKYVSIRDAAMQKRLDNIEIALNNILHYWDEELESWAFEAGSVSLSSIVNGKPLCMCVVDSKTAGDKRGSNGGRSLDEIVKFGAILSPNQGIIPEETINQLASLCRAFSSEELTEMSNPRPSSQQNLVDGGYDYYGLDDECQKQRLAHVLMIKTRKMDRRRLLKAIIDESYEVDDLRAPFCKDGPSQPILSTRNEDVTSIIEAINVSEHDADQQINQVEKNERITSEDDMNCLKEQVKVLNQVEKALKNTALVLNLDLDRYKGLSATKSLQIMEERTTSSATTIYHTSCNRDDPQILMSIAAELAVSTTLILENNHDLPFDIIDDRYGYINRTDSGNKSESTSGICKICCGTSSEIISATPSNSVPQADTPISNSTAATIASHDVDIVPSNTADDTDFSVSISGSNVAIMSDSSTNGSEIIKVATLETAEPMKLRYSSSDGIGGVNNYGNYDDCDGVNNYNSNDSVNCYSGQYGLYNGSDCSAIVDTVVDISTYSNSNGSSDGKKNDASVTVKRDSLNSISDHKMEDLKGSAPLPLSFNHSINLSSPPVRSRRGSWMSPDGSDTGVGGLESHLSSVCPTEEDNGYSPFTDSDKSWVEWWWDLNPALNEGREARDEEVAGELPGIALKRRITTARLKNKFKTKSRIHEEVEFRSLNVGTSKDALSIAQFNSHYPSNVPSTTKNRYSSQRVVLDINSVDSLAAIRAESSPRNMYDITVIAPKGLGLNLTLVRGYALLVRAFNVLADGSVGPVERAGIVKGGDYLLGVNEISLIGMGLEQIAEILLNIDRMGKVNIHQIALTCDIF
jgi:hypothetical protein